MLSVEVKEVKDVDEVKDRSRLAGPIRKVGDLLVYKQAYNLALVTSKLTKSLPRDEQFELGRQLRRSSRSVAVDEGLANRKSAEDLLKEYSKLGFMIHNLWKEWRKL